MRSKAGKLEITTTGSTSVTGLSFQPKLVIFFTGGQSTEGFFGGLEFMLSATDGSYSGVHGITSRNGQTAGDAINYSRTSEPIYLRDVAGTTIMLATLTSLNSDGFTLDVTTAVSSVDIYYLAIGGSDISVDVGNFATNTTTGSQSITGVGFEPEALILFGGTVFTGTATNDANMSIGSSDGTNTKCIGVYSDDGAGTTNTTRIARDGYILNIMTTGTGSAVGYQATLTSLDSDGFTINCTNNTNAIAHRIQYIALRGVNVEVNEVATSTSSAVSVSKTGVPFKPEAGIFFSACTDGNSTLQDDSIGSFSFVDENEDCYALGWFDDDAQADTVVSSYQSDSVINRVYMNTLTASMNGYAEFTSWNSDGYTMNMANGDPSPSDLFALLLSTKDEDVHPIWF